MSDNPSIFFDEWQACLHAHYIYVIRTGDTVTEPTLREVLLHSGLSEKELRALQDEALALGPLDPGGEAAAESVGESADELYDLPEDGASDALEDKGDTPADDRQLSLF
jgi:hypothetical protein